MNRRHLYMLCSILTAIGLSTFAYKVLVLEFPTAPDERAEIWRADVKIRFVGEGQPVKVTMAIPTTTDQYALIDQHFVSPGYGLTMSPSDANRQAVFTTRSDRGEQIIYYRAVIQRTGAQPEPKTGPAPKPGKFRFKD